jgi:hypothetical protein
MGWSRQAKRVDYYYLSLNAMPQPMSVPEDPTEYERYREMDGH